MADTTTQQYYVPWMQPSVPSTVASSGQSSSGQSTGSWASGALTPAGKLFADLNNMLFEATPEGAPRRSPLGLAAQAYNRIDDYLDYEAPEFVNMLSYMIPALGTARTAEDFVENANAGNTGGAAADLALTLLSLAPGLGGVGAGLGKTAAKAVKGVTRAGTKAAKKGAKYADDIAALAKQAGRELTAEEKAIIKQAGVGKTGWLERGISKAAGEDLGFVGSRAARRSLDDAMDAIRGGGGKTINEAAIKEATAGNKLAGEVDDVLEELATALEKGENEAAEAAAGRLADMLGGAEAADKYFMSGGKSIFEGADAASNAAKLRQMKSTGSTPVRSKVNIPGETKGYVSSSGKAYTPEEIKSTIDEVLDSLKETQAGDRVSSFFDFFTNPNRGLRKLEDAEQKHRLKYSPLAYAGRIPWAMSAVAAGPGQTEQGMQAYADRILSDWYNKTGRYAYMVPTRY